jgi:hypothetical protein
MVESHRLRRGEEVADREMRRMLARANDHQPRQRLGSQSRPHHQTRKLAASASLVVVDVIIVEGLHDRAA